MKSYAFLAAFIPALSCGGLFDKPEPAVKKCMDPPAEVYKADLAFCRQNPEQPELTCCAYPFLLPSMQLCLHVLCSPDSCSEFTYQETLCMPMPEQPEKKDARNEDSDSKTNPDSGTQDPG
jgi:hypothetical protein